MEHQFSYTSRHISKVEAGCWHIRRRRHRCNMVGSWSIGESRPCDLPTAELVQRLWPGRPRDIRDIRGRYAGASRRRGQQTTERSRCTLVAFQDWRITTKDAYDTRSFGIPREGSNVLGDFENSKGAVAGIPETIVQIQTESEWSERCWGGAAEFHSLRRVWHRGDDHRYGHAAKGLWWRRDQDRGKTTEHRWSRLLPLMMHGWLELHIMISKERKSILKLANLQSNIHPRKFYHSSSIYLAIILWGKVRAKP